MSIAYRQPKVRNIGAHFGRYRNFYVFVSTTWTFIIGLLILGICLAESRASFGGWCGTCVAEARFSLYVVNPLLLCTSILSTSVVRLLNSAFYRLTRFLTFASFAVVVAPICAILYANYIETLH